MVNEAVLDKYMRLKAQKEQAEAEMLSIKASVVRELGEDGVWELPVFRVVVSQAPRESVGPLQDIIDRFGRSALRGLLKKTMVTTLRVMRR